MLFAIGIVLFGIPLQAGFTMLMSLFQRRFGRSTVEEKPALMIRSVATWRCRCLLVAGSVQSR